VSRGAWLARLQPRRTIRPTRDGWWCLGAALALGFAAMNTGNNLLYLLASLLLALIVVSGVLSEQSLRRLRPTPIVPDELYAGRPALLGARLANDKRWLPSHSVTVRAGDQRFYVDRLRAGEEILLTWETMPRRRGLTRLPGLRVTTRFPFGLFVKRGRPLAEQEIVVFPAVRPLDVMGRRSAASGDRSLHRRGRGHDLHNLREYRAGDDRRLIHWRSTARTGTLTVRELEDETSAATRIVLVGDGTRDAQRLEAALSEAASLAVHLLAAGAPVELTGPGVHVPAGRGQAQRRRLLTALALYDPPGPGGAPARRRGRGSEIEVALG
jgi:uncharacterized protein (DUF58 family)